MHFFYSMDFNGGILVLNIKLCMIIIKDKALTNYIN